MEYETMKEAAKGIRLIALDMDGTCMNSKAEVSPHTRSVIQRLIDRGYMVVPATGRSLHGLQERILGVHGIRYVISDNGAMLTDGATGELLYRRIIPYAIAADLAQMLFEDRCCVYFCEDGGHKHVEACKDRQFYREHFQHPDSKGSDSIVTSMPGQIILERKKDILKMGVHFRREDGFAYFENLAQQHFPELNCFRVAENNLEFTNNCASKDMALRLLCQKLNIRREQVLAIGDNGNDVAMIEFAGIGVAMGNAIASVKHKADYIAGCNDEDGAACFLEQLFL